MIRKSFLLAAAVAALSFAGESAQAAFTFSTTTTPSTATAAGVTFTFIDQPTTNVAGTLGAPNVNINSAGTPTGGTGTFTVNTVITVTSNGVSGTFTEVASYNVNQNVYTSSGVSFVGPTTILVDGST